MSDKDYTLCDCCGGYKPCKPYMLGIEHSLFNFESDDEPGNKSEKWLCAGCYDPSMEVTGVIPTCVHCGLKLLPSEYRLQLCASHSRSRAGIESRARYNHLRKKKKQH